MADDTKAKIVFAGENKIGKAVDSVKKDLSSLANASDKFGSMITKAFTFTAVVAAFKKLSAAASECIKLFDTQIKAEKSFEVVLANLGGAFASSTKELKDYASALQSISVYGDEVILEAEKILASTDKLNVDGLKKSTALALDMASALGEDLTSSANRLAKALAEPEKAVNSLKSAHITFSDEVENTIKNLVSEGRELEAQELIFKRIEEVFGGMSKDLADLPTSKLTQISNVVGDIKEGLGQGLVTALEPALDYLLDRLNGISRWISTVNEGQNFNKLLIEGDPAKLKTTFTDEYLRNAIAEREASVESLKSTLGTYKGVDLSFDNAADAISAYLNDFSPSTGTKILNFLTSPQGVFTGGKEGLFNSSEMEAAATYISRYYKALEELSLLNSAIAYQIPTPSFSGSTGTSTSTTEVEDPIATALAKYGNLSTTYTRQELSDTITALESLRDSLLGSTDFYSLAVFDEIIKALKEQLDPTVETIDELAKYIEGNGTKSLSYNLEQARAKAETAWSTLNGMDATDPLYNIVKEIAVAIQGEYDQMLTASGFKYDPTARAMAAGKKEESAEESITLLDRFGEVLKKYDFVQTFISLGDPLTYLVKIFDGMLEVIRPAIDSILMPIFNVLSTIGKILGTLLLPVLEPIAAIISWICDWIGYLGNVISTFIYNISHPFNTRDYQSRPSGLNDHYTDVVNSGYSTATGTAVASASYQGGQTVTINIYQQSPVVGDNGMRAFAGMIKEEFDALNYYGVGA